MLVVGGSTAYNLVDLFRCSPRITRRRASRARTRYPAVYVIIVQRARVLDAVVIERVVLKLGPAIGVLS
jgi:hypothetical protein